MIFREGDKVEFILLGELKQGVVTEIKESKFHDLYLINFDGEGEPVWRTKYDLSSPTPALKVPRFADDWINHCKQREYDLACLLDYEDSDMSAEMTDWLCLEESNQGLLARAWLGGYEVEKEPLYYIKLINKPTGYLNVRSDGAYYLGGSGQTSGFKTEFTKAEIDEMDKGEAYWLLKERVKAEAG
ncbi:DUF1642 domain-containing protein [Listeria marthii]|uniref:DUF1642 domain-containing protein n=1 Tax=Listeria marthii TaxID=529731 RepID=UPI0018874557|nr:DUF1642 domain-containing protein [Listeria marthii]MBF2350100.1 DUF1642 domain-containing protein [Listeria marthii]